MKIRDILLIFLYSTLLDIFCNGVDLNIAENKTFIFLSGWPQSGTSLLQQILAEAKFMSTMIEKCANFYGKRCTNWNNEGQWMLKVPSPLQAGIMCPLENALTFTEIASIRTQVRVSASLFMIAIINLDFSTYFPSGRIFGF
jgi:hypothetical protein